MSGKPRKNGRGRSFQPTKSHAREEEKPQVMRYFPFAIGILVVLGLGASYLLSHSVQPVRPLTSQVSGPYGSTIGGETRPTLDSARFPGKIGQAYQLAREIPQVLDQIYCYCECQENFSHKSLLSCYVDLHAAA